MSELRPASEEHLYERIASILDEARSRVARTVNTAMVHAYWLIGRELVEVEQQGAERAGYGEGLMKGVAARLSAKFGKGFSLASLKRMKQFYLAFPHGSALADGGEGKGSTPLSLSPETDGVEKGAAALSLSASPTLLFPPMLAWSHYLVLVRVTRPEARSFYEIEAARESWSVRELERQVAALLFDRLAMNKNPEQVLTLARKGQQVSVPSDVLKDPFFDRFQRAEHEAKTIGIVLCSDKNDAMVRITLPDDNEQVLAARYQMYLPTEEELRTELAREREEAEPVLRLTADVNQPANGEG